MSNSCSKPFWAFSVALFCFQQIVTADGIVTNCDEASLRAAIVGGGTVTFACDGTIMLSNTVSITSDTTLDATGRAVIVSGGSAIRLFIVNTNVTFVLKSLTLADGLARGTNGGPGIDGGPGEGGAIYNNGGTVSTLNCAFLRNTAQGGEGGAGPNLPPSPRNGDGGAGSGGAVYVNGGFLNATNCIFAVNYSLGGTGAVYAGSISPISLGGDAKGGAIHNQGGAIQLVNCLVSSNQALGGPGRRYSVLGASFGGTAYGGAVCNSTGELWVVHCTVSTNSSTGGKSKPAYGGAIYKNGGNLHIVESLLESNKVTGGAGFPGAFMMQIPGGAAYGGGCSIAAGAIWLTNSTLSGNLALGGAGSYVGDVGSAFGAGVFNSGTLQATNSTIFGNTARSGTPGYSVANQGSGLGGGLYNNGGSMVLNYVTISGNSAEQITGGTPGTGSALGGGIYSTSGTATLHGTIVANSLSGSNASGNLVDGGYNLSSDSSCNFTNTGSLNNTDPKLGPLDDYGGPTPTMPLLANSPAIDGGDNVACLPADQRGHARPYGAACDIGAFESSPPFVIRGRVSGFTLREDVSITAGLVNTMTTNRDSYNLEGLAASTYAVTPSHSNYLFVPSNRSVTTGPDQLNIDFKAYRWNALSIEDVSNGVLHLAYAGTNGQTHRVLASSNLTDWLPISTNTVGSSNLFHVFDPMEQRSRLYRTVRP